jgi:hypothetical protein
MRLGGLILLVLVVLALAFVTAPWWTFRSMRDAARSGDSASLAKMIDYDSVRDSLSAQLAGQPPPPPPPSIWKNPIGAIEHMFQKPPTPPAQTERYVSPGALADMADGLDAGAPLPPANKEPFPGIAFWGPDRCRIVVHTPSDKTRVTEFTFERRGIFIWKLVRIVLPPHPPAATPAPAAAPAPAH